jgi:hypothetical protein
MVPKNTLHYNLPIPLSHVEDLSLFRQPHPEILLGLLLHLSQ